MFSMHIFHHRKKDEKYPIINKNKLTILFIFSDLLNNQGVVVAKKK
jgi:hypothetical protein